MVCKAKTFSSAGGVYVAPHCKIYSITAESCILQGSDYGGSGEAGGDLGGGEEHDL